MTPLALFCQHVVQTVRLATTCTVPSPRLSLPEARLSSTLRFLWPSLKVLTAASLLTVDSLSSLAFTSALALLIPTTEARCEYFSSTLAIQTSRYKLGTISPSSSSNVWLLPVSPRSLSGTLPLISPLALSANQPPMSLTLSL